MTYSVIDKLRFTPDRLFNAQAISRKCMGISIVLMVIAVFLVEYMRHFHSGQEDLAESLALLIWVSILMVSTYSLALRSRHRVVCKALAGLELHQYHCAEDLVFGLGIEYNLAEAIVQGEYDCLLMDRVTCYYIH